MYDTPVKGFLSKNTSLRDKIQSKLWTDKKILDCKQNLTKYQSHIKNPNQANFVQRSIRQDLQSISKSNSFFYDSLNVTQSAKDNKYEPQITQQNILEFESLQNQNFYGFEEWMQFNKKFFSQVDDNTIKILWKIMRTINYGDVLIPSGLIFQVSKILSCKKNEKEGLSLKKVFNEFLQLNNISDRVNNFRQLRNYPALEKIQKAYAVEKNVQKSALLQKGKSYSSLKNIDEKKSVFERNYENSKQRNELKKRNIFKSLIGKQYDPECVFKPQINEYCPKKLFVDQTSRNSRTCYSNGKWMTERMKENDFMETYNFKASPFERSRFQNQSLEEIPGVTQHIERRKQSQAKKRKLQRYLAKPTLVFRND